MKKNKKKVFAILISFCFSVFLFVGCVLEAPQEELVQKSEVKISTKKSKSSANVLQLNFTDTEIEIIENGEVKSGIENGDFFNANVSYSKLRDSSQTSDLSINASSISDDLTIILSGKKEKGGIRIISSKEHEIEILIQNVDCTNFVVSGDGEVSVSISGNCSFGELSEPAARSVQE